MIISLNCCFFLLPSISVPRVSIDGEPHETLALVVCASGLVIATIIITIIAILLRKVNLIEWEKMKTTSTKPQNDIEASPSESVTIAESSVQDTASNSMEPVIEFETIESVRVCEPIGHSAHVMDRPKIGIFTIFGSHRQSFDLK